MEAVRQALAREPERFQAWLDAALQEAESAEVVEALLAAGADPCASDCGALFAAACAGNRAVAEAVLRAMPARAAARSAPGAAAWAAENGHAELAELLGDVPPGEGDEEMEEVV
jgi:hypothetical protein